MYCPNCGAQNNDDATYCANCGNELRQIRTPTADVPPPPQYLCCLPFGIVSIVYAAQVNGKITVGARAGALQSSKTLRCGLGSLSDLEYYSGFSGSFTSRHYIV